MSCPRFGSLVATYALLWLNTPNMEPICKHIYFYVPAVFFILLLPSSTIKWNCSDTYLLHVQKRRKNKSFQLNLLCLVVKISQMCKRNYLISLKSTMVRCKVYDENECVFNSRYFAWVLMTAASPVLARCNFENPKQRIIMDSFHVIEIEFSRHGEFVWHL